MKIRKASLADVPSIETLIAASARALAADDYSAEQIEAALLGAWGVDTELIRDGTYFVGEEDGGLILCGGWSRRATSFGGDAYDRRESRLLDPRTEAARIRAFFVHPRWARRGLASRLLALCESEARAAGFMAAELVATLPGVRLYARHGYVPEGRRRYDLPGGASIEFVPMRRALGRDGTVARNVKQAVPFFMVTDMEASLRFYVDGVGFAVTKEWRPAEAGGRIRWCWLELGDAALMLQEYSRDRRPDGPLGQGVSVCFMCADAIALYREFVARGVDARRPFVGNGLWVTSVRDPNGYQIDFESPADVPEETVFSDHNHD